MDSKNRILVVLALMLLGVAGRFLFADVPNFSPVGAIALFAGASFLDKRIAMILPLAIMLVSDWIIGFHSAMPFVYAGMAIYAALGMWAGNQLKPMRLVPAAVVGSVIFFVLTNFGSFLAFYPYSWAGLVECYVAAIPFYRNTLAADLLFGAVLFGALAAAQYYWPKLKPATV